MTRVQPLLKRFGQTVNRCLYKRQGLMVHLRAFSLAETLIALALLGVLAVLSINMLTQVNDSPGKWGRVANDFVTHLEMACNTVRLSQGTGPLNARKVATSAPVDPSKHNYEYMYTATSTEDPDGYQSAAYTTQCATHPDIPNTYICNNAYRGLSQFLPNWETMIQSKTGPDRLEYPKGLVLYLKPDAVDVSDPNNEISNEGADSTPASFDHDDIMDTTDDREWVLLDMNGSALPNSIAAGGDRVLLHVDDDSCKVLTARQKCKMVNSSGTCNDTSVTTYPQSFYDVYKKYCSDWTTNCPY